MSRNVGPSDSKNFPSSTIIGLVLGKHNRIFPEDIRQDMLAISCYVLPEQVRNSRRLSLSQQYAIVLESLRSAYPAISAIENYLGAIGQQQDIDVLDDSKEAIMQRQKCVEKMGQWGQDCLDNKLWEETVTARPLDMVAFNALCNKLRIKQDGSPSVNGIKSNQVEFSSDPDINAAGQAIYRMVNAYRLDVQVLPEIQDKKWLRIDLAKQETAKLIKVLSGSRIYESYYHTRPYDGPIPKKLGPDKEIPEISFLINLEAIARDKPFLQRISLIAAASAQTGGRA